MKRTLLLIAVAGAGALLVGEATMQPSNADRVSLLALFGAAGVATAAFYGVAARFGSRFGSVGALLGAVAVGSVAVTAGAVALAAQTMFISSHDRNLVFVALILGVGLGVALSVSYSKSITEDLEVLGATARAVEEGNLTARVGLKRADEIGVAAAAFDSMAAALEASTAERQMLIGSVSHDLRTPLASLQAAVEALEDGIAPDPAAYLKGMANDIGYLAELIDDLFTLARVESGAGGLALEECDLAELVDEAIEAMGPLAGSRHVEISAAEPSGAVFINADATAIGRVIRNLLDNAIAQSPVGAAVIVEVGEGATFAVVDSGPGFPADLGDRVFDRFVTGDSHRPAGEGSGLGLAICRGIVEAHGGTIRIGTGPGGRVEVSLPG